MQSAETLHGREVYSHSLSAVRELGRLAVETSHSEVLNEVDGRAVRTWNDFYTKIEEHITTDPEYGESLYFDSVRTFEIRGGSVVDENGQPIVKMIRNGHEASLHASKEDPRMEVQAKRDLHDIELAEAVETLEIGEMIGALSMDPKQAIAQDREFWEDTMHYREGMAIWQWYYRVSDTELKTGVIAIKKSDVTAMRLAFSKLGHEVPRDLDDADWIRHHVRGHVSIDEAKKYGQKLKDNHREVLGDASKEFSATNFMHEQLSTIKSYYGIYMPKIAVAAFNGENDSTLQDFARALSHVETVSWDKRVQLLQISRKKFIDDSDVRLLDTMVSYALVEELRKNLPQFMSHDTNHDVMTDFSPLQPIHNNYRAIQLVAASVLHTRQNELLQQMVANVRSGTEAGRSYGGCSGSAVHGTRRENPEDEVVFGPQSIFGGKVEGQKSDDTVDEDQFGALNFECTKGHKNRRPRGKLIDKCTTCHEDVSCQEPETVKSEVKAKNLRRTSIIETLLGEETYERAKAS